jgi:putative DNA primase/helicase
LYNLPEVAKAHEVIIVEGEKDADILVRLSDPTGAKFISTTCPMGAKKWRSHYNQYLKDKNVVLIPDNDPQGKEHVEQIASSLYGTARSIKIVKLPDLPDKGDITDFGRNSTDDGETAEQLSVLIENAPVYKPQSTNAYESAILTTQDFCKLIIEPRKLYIHPWLKEDSVNLLSGSRGVGKTFAGLGILDAVTKESAFGPWECQNSVPCLFLDGEMTVSDNQERIELLRLNTDRKSPLYFYSDAYANRLGLPRAQLVDEEWRFQMKELLLKLGVKLWVVDNIASLASGLDENVKKDWDPINQWLLELRFAGICSVLLHHTNKEGGQRGTSAREDNLDISILLKPPFDYTPEEGARFIFRFSKARIANKHLNLIGDAEFKLIQDQSGYYTWSYSNIQQDKKREVLKYIGEGLNQKTIADIVGISKGYVSKIVKEAIDKGYINAKGKNIKLTIQGKNHISDLLYKPDN